MKSTIGPILIALLIVATVTFINHRYQAANKRLQEESMHSDPGSVLFYDFESEEAPIDIEEDESVISGEPSETSGFPNQKE